MDGWMQVLEDMEWKRLVIAWGGRIVVGMLVFMIGLQIAKWFSSLVEQRLTRRHVEITAVKFLHRVVYGVILVLVVITALLIFNVPMGSMIAVLGAAGLAIGLALKDSLSNIASGVMLVTLKPFRIGDLVNINNQTGTVESVNVFQTQLRGGDNQTIVVPNSLITSESIINLTPGVRRRVELVIGIGYADSIEAARKIILELMQSDERILAEPAPDVLVYDLADDRVNLGIRCHTSNEDNFVARCSLTERIKAAFDAAGISIPFPQRDVHLYRHAASDGDMVGRRQPGGLAQRQLEGGKPF